MRKRKRIKKNQNGKRGGDEEGDEGNGVIW